MAKKTKPKKKHQAIKKKNTSSKNYYSSKRIPFPLLIALAVTIIAFIPSLFNDFVTWDDDVNILKNPNLQVFDWRSIKGIFTDTVIGNYNPLAILSLAIEKAIFGLNATVIHIDNLLLHLVCVCFTYKIGIKLHLSPIAAGLIALLFGIHPMRVESVAWVTERKDVLYGAFYFAAIYTYLLYTQSDKKQKGYFWATIGLFALALLSKIQAVSLPLSLLTIDYFLKRKLNFKLILEKAPYFLMSLAIGILGILFLSTEGSLEQVTDYSLWERLLVGGYTYLVYLAKFIFPYKMSPLYPYPSVIGWHFYVGTALLLPLFAGLFYAFKQQKSALLFGFAFFTFNILFMLQILGAGQAFLADRFTYVPYFGLFFIIGFYYQEFIQQKPKIKRGLTIGLGTYLLVFAVMTWQQNKIWKNGETLWTHVLKYYNKIDTPYSNRAQYYRDQGNINEALADYNKAIEVKPKKGSTYNSRGKTYFDLGGAQNDRTLVQKAIEDYTKGIELEPELGELYANRGAALGYLGKTQQALADLNKAIELEPNKQGGYANRSLLYMQNSNYELAIKDHTVYLNLNPYDAEVWYERGLAKSRLNQHQEAISDYNRALELEDNRGIFYMQRSQAYKGLNNKAQAIKDIQKAQKFGAKVPDSYWKGLR